MPAWRREADAVVVALLGTSAYAWTEWNAEVPPSAQVVLSAVGHAAPADQRAHVLAVLAASAAMRVVLVDHNRPRRIAAALAAIVRSPWVAGRSPFARWRRLAHPVARELQAAGFTVERLRLVAGERVQVIAAVRRPK